jgi:hypothetical protein
MTLRKVLTGLMILGLLLWFSTVAYADDPPKPTDTLPQPTDTPPQKGSFAPVPIQAAKAVLDPDTASVTYLDLDEDDKTSVPAVPRPQSPSPSKGSFEPDPIMLAHFDGETFHAIPNSADVASDYFVGQRSQPDAAGGKVGIASSTVIMSEDFEGPLFPVSGWSRNDVGGTGHLWDDVNCFPVESGGMGSAWPADEGINGLDPCTGDDYPNNLNSWLVYGPFSLADAQSASLDFFFRIESESVVDRLFWGASVDGSMFYGASVSGTYTSGPFNNGYNFASLDLTDVYVLGDLSGQSQVWIAFQFLSNFSNTGQGPFIDAISLRKNTDTRTNLTDENFDLISFPNQFWESFDNDGPTNGDYRWDDVQCFARSDGWSMWPADNGADAVDVCAGAPYPNNAQSWLVHGPLNLTGASEAWVDFYFRNESEVFWDRFSWMVSLDGIRYWGFYITGDQTNGPYGNGYNLMRFDLSDVFGLGDLRGEPEVWLAYLFNSDFSNTGQGPFLDDVKVVVEGSGVNQVYLPLLSAAPAQPITTNLYVENQTSGSVSYTVENTPEGNITCSNIPAGTTQFCGSFTPGTYEVSVSTTECGSNTGEVSFMPGDVPRVVRCVSQ